MERKTPEEWLASTAAQANPSTSKRGRLKLFVGFAAGVGKTYEMLQEANRRKNRERQDIVVGYIETHGRQGTQEQIGNLEIIPRKKIEYRGSLQEEMDLDAVLARHPAWCVVDELAHTNVPGSKNEKRWQDIYEFLEAGINVLSTVNIQHLESLNDKILEVTGIKVRETLPDRVLAEADEIVDVDVTPRALRNRIERGEVYKHGNIEQALDNFFREDRLTALRELCMREVAARIDKEYEKKKSAYLREKPAALAERVLICVSPGPNAQRVINRGNRLAKTMDGAIEAVYAQPAGEPVKDPQALKEIENNLKRLDIPFHLLQGNPAREIAGFVKQRGITHIVIGHRPFRGLQALTRNSVLDEILRYLPDIAVTVVGERP